MIDLITEAHRFQTFCRQNHWRFCFIGGLAVQHWGEPRLTRDIDLTLLTGFGREQEFVATILKSYQPRRNDAQQFALTHRVLLAQSEAGIGLDISLGALPFEEEMIDRALDIEFVPGIELRICAPEDLIVMKSFAGRPLDWQDAASVIIRQGSDSLDWNYIETNLRPLAELKDAPEIMDELRRLRTAN